MKEVNVTRETMTPTFKLQGSVQLHQATKGARAVSLEAWPLIVTGGLDGVLAVVRGTDLETLATRNLGDLIYSLAVIPKVAAVLEVPAASEVAAVPEVAGESIRKDEARILVGTKAGHIGDVTLSGSMLSGSSYLAEKHGGVVSSLSLSEEKVVSGSWDGSLRFWQRPSGAPLGAFTHPELQYIVTVCAVDSEFTLAASSAGSLLLLSQGELVHSVTKAHDDAIRSICVVNKASSLASSASLTTPASTAPSVRNYIVATCSNAGNVKLWKVDLDSRKIESCPSADWCVTDHRHFVFDVTSVVFEADGPRAADLVSFAIFAACDAGILACRRYTTQLLDVVPVSGYGEVVWKHPREVWAVAASPDGRAVASVCGDGKLRVFTSDQTRWLDEATVAATVEEDRASAPKRDASGSEVDVSKLPLVSEKAQKRGTKVGQTVLFASADRRNVEVCSWTGSEWSKVGDMVSGEDAEGGGGGGNASLGGKDGFVKADQYYEGCDFFPAGVYDHVFNVEIDNRSGGLKLPFRLTDNPMEVAERFCASHALPKNNVQDIVKFIMQNSRANQTSFASPTPYTPAPPQATPQVPPREDTTRDVHPSHFGSETLPIIFAQDAKWDQVQKKILELNEEQTEELRLNTDEKNALSNLVHMLQSCRDARWEMKNSYHHFLFSFDNKWMRWQPQSSLFPFVDLWRRVLAVDDALRKFDGGLQHIYFVLNLIDPVNSDSTSLTDSSAALLPPPLLVCSLRFLCNCLAVSSSRAMLMKNSARLVALADPKRVLAKIGPETPQHAACLTAHASLIHNICLACVIQKRTDSSFNPSHILDAVSNSRA